MLVSVHLLHACCMHKPWKAVAAIALTECVLVMLPADARMAAGSKLCYLAVLPCHIQCAKL
jgi:hypothetical protein